jgi:hypothetical protein
MIWEEPISKDIVTNVLTLGRMVDVRNTTINRVMR